MSAIVIFEQQGDKCPTCTRPASKMTNCSSNAMPFLRSVILPQRFLAYAPSQLQQQQQRFYLLFTYKTVLSVETTTGERQDRLQAAYL